VLFGFEYSLKAVCSFSMAVADVVVVVVAVVVVLSGFTGD